MTYSHRNRKTILSLLLLSVTISLLNHSHLHAVGKESGGKESASDSWSGTSPLDSEDGALGSPRSRVREGTRIGSTTGKFYRNGRRWVFEFAVPVEAAGAEGATANQNVQEFREITTRTTDQLTTTTVVSSSRSASSTSTASSPTSSAPAVEIVRMRVLENLALQRVVTAITEDTNDIHWTVTGTVTEFGNENWLLLSTVLRSPTSKPE